MLFDSLNYAPVNVSGYTTHDNENIPGISMTFAPDRSVKNNTAQQTSATSNSTGFYVAKLIPGTYNVTVRETEGATTVYTFEGKISVTIGEGNVYYNLSLTKVSVTVTGSVRYDVGKANMTILFTKDLRVVNNTAITNSVITDQYGLYTIELYPGSYNASVEELVNESGENVTYFGSGYITLNPGDTPKILNIILTRVESS